MHYERDFIIDEKEIVRFHQSILRKGLWLKLLGAAAAGALVGWVYVTWAGIKGTTGQMVTWMAVCASFTVMGASVVMFVNNRNQIRRSLGGRGVSTYSQSVLIDAFGVHVEANGSKGKAGFEKLNMVKEDRHAFYIFLTPSQAWIMPKDQMENAEEESRQLREMFSRVIESRRLKFLK